MATIKQKRLARGIAEALHAKRIPNQTTLVESAGYAPETARANSHRTLAQKGVQEELEELGFDIESAKRVLKRILTHGKEENRIKAAQEIFKVEGAYAPEKHLNTNLTISFDGVFSPPPPQTEGDRSE